MTPLQITAYMANGIAVYDDWSPALEGLIVFELLKSKQLLIPNPSEDDARATMSMIKGEIPLAMWEGLFKCSAPIYQYVTEETTKYRKRWEPDGKVAWGKRKPKFSTSEGPEKSYDLPLFLRLTSRIDWFAVGDRDRIQSLLNDVHGIGKKRSHGYGQVVRWEVHEIDDDWSIVKDGQLMKPIPLEIFKTFGLNFFHDLANWGYVPPAWLPGNKTLCVMPRMVNHG